MDVGDDDTADAVWLTYGELAKVRNITRAAAIRLVQRRKWRRQAGNDGLARVYVPRDWAKPGEVIRDIIPDVTADDIPASAPDVTDHVEDNGTDSVAPDVTPAVQAFETALAALQAAKDGHISTLREQLEWADSKIARQEAELKASQEAVRRAESALDRHYRAEAERRGQRLLRRLRAAWRGD